jgi:hypothetical protein
MHLKLAGPTACIFLASIQFSWGFSPASGDALLKDTLPVKGKKNVGKIVGLQAVLSLVSGCAAVGRGGPDVIVMKDFGSPMTLALKLTCATNARLA